MVCSHMRLHLAPTAIRRARQGAASQLEVFQRSLGARAPNRFPNLLRRTILSLRRADSLLRSSLGPTAQLRCSSLVCPARFGLARLATVGQPVRRSRKLVSNALGRRNADLLRRASSEALEIPTSIPAGLFLARLAPRRSGSVGVQHQSPRLAVLLTSVVGFDGARSKRVMPAASPRWKLLFHLALTPASHGRRVEGRAVGDAREEGSRQRSGSGARRPWASITSPSAGRLLLTCAHRGPGSRSWPDSLGGWTATPPSHFEACSTLGARWRVPPPRCEGVSERVITVYESVLRDDRADSRQRTGARALWASMVEHRQMRCGRPLNDQLPGGSSGDRVSATAPRASSKSTARSIGDAWLVTTTDTGRRWQAHG